MKSESANQEPNQTTHSNENAIQISAQMAIPKSAKNIQEINKIIQKTVELRILEIVHEAFQKALQKSISNAINNCAQNAISIAAKNDTNNTSNDSLPKAIKNSIPISSQKTINKISQQRDQKIHNNLIANENSVIGYSKSTEKKQNRQKIHESINIQKSNKGFFSTIKQLFGLGGQNQPIKPPSSSSLLISLQNASTKKGDQFQQDYLSSMQQTSSLLSDIDKEKNQ